MVKISEDMRKLVVHKMLGGQSQVSVAKGLNIGRTTIRYIFQKYMKMSKVPDSKKSVVGLLKQLKGKGDYCAGHSTLILL